MTEMTRVTDSAGRAFRICRQRNPVTCGPAACLMMWANAYDADPVADEGGVIALSQQFADSWTAARGANIANLVRVLAQMGVNTTLHRFHGDFDTLGKALGDKVGPRRPALAFLQWRGAASVVGHFVVVGSAVKAIDHYTLLDPAYGLQETLGTSFYMPTADDGDQPTLLFTGAVALMN